MRVDSQPAYILHTRSFRDSSLIIEFLTADYGRVSAVLKGVRSNGKSAKQKQGVTQPLIPLLISWSGKSELKTATQIEARTAPMVLQGNRLFSALYVNELLTRLLRAGEEHADIFSLYEWVLGRLQNTEQAVEPILRHFELSLLEALGYGLNLSVESATGAAVKPDHFYQLRNGQEIVAVEAKELERGLYLGADLLEIASRQYSEQSRRAAKRICRQALEVHLGNKPLKSRELFS